MMQAIKAADLGGAQVLGCLLDWLLGSSYPNQTAVSSKPDLMCTHNNIVFE